MGNRYSVPLGTYDGREKVVEVIETPENILVISDLETKQELARHTISFEKGKLVKNNNHGRDRSKGVFCKRNFLTFAKIFPQAPVGKFYVNPSNFSSKISYV